MAKKTNSSRTTSGEPGTVESAARTVVNPDAPSVDTTSEQNESSDSADARERIAARAYELYLQRGGAHGRATDDWLEAEREISGSSRTSRSSER